MDAREIQNMFPDSKESLQLEAIQFFSNKAPVIHFFHEIVHNYLKLREITDETNGSTKYSAVLLKIESALNYVWENLHTGQWKDVDTSWRQLYSYISLFKAYIQLALHTQDSKTGFSKAIEALDMGLIMGEPILNNLLSKIADKLNEKLWKLSNLKDFDVKDVGDNEQEVSCHFHCDPNKSVETYHLPSIETFLLEIMGKKAAVIAGKIIFVPKQDKNLMTNQ